MAPFNNSGTLDSTPRYGSSTTPRRRRFFPTMCKNPIPCERHDHCGFVHQDDPDYADAQRHEFNVNPSSRPKLPRFDGSTRSKPGSSRSQDFPIPSAWVGPSIIPEWRRTGSSQMDDSTSSERPGFPRFGRASAHKDLSSLPRRYMYPRFDPRPTKKAPPPQFFPFSPSQEIKNSSFAPYFQHAPVSVTEHPDRWGNLMIRGSIQGKVREESIAEAMPCKQITRVFEHSLAETTSSQKAAQGVSSSDSAQFVSIPAQYPQNYRHVTSEEEPIGASCVFANGEGEIETAELATTIRQPVFKSDIEGSLVSRKSSDGSFDSPSKNLDGVSAKLVDLILANDAAYVEIGDFPVSPSTSRGGYSHKGRNENHSLESIMTAINLRTFDLPHFSAGTIRKQRWDKKQQKQRSSVSPTGSQSYLHIDPPQKYIPPHIRQQDTLITWPNHDLSKSLFNMNSIKDEFADRQPNFLHQNRASPSFDQHSNNKFWLCQLFKMPFDDVRSLDYPGVAAAQRYTNATDVEISLGTIGDNPNMHFYVKKALNGTLYFKTCEEGPGTGEKLCQTIVFYPDGSTAVQKDLPSSLPQKPEYPLGSFQLKENVQQQKLAQASSYFRSQRDFPQAPQTPFDHMLSRILFSSLAPSTRPDFNGSRSWTQGHYYNQQDNTQHATSREQPVFSSQFPSLEETSPLAISHRNGSRGSVSEKQRYTKKVDYSQHKLSPSADVHGQKKTRILPNTDPNLPKKPNMPAITSSYIKDKASKKARRTKQKQDLKPTMKLQQTVCDTQEIKKETVAPLPSPQYVARLAIQEQFKNQVKAQLERKNKATQTESQELREDNQVQSPGAMDLHLPATTCNRSYLKLWKRGLLIAPVLRLGLIPHKKDRTNINERILDLKNSITLEEEWLTQLHRFAAKQIEQNYNIISQNMKGMGYSKQLSMKRNDPPRKPQDIDNPDVEYSYNTTFLENSRWTEKSFDKSRPNLLVQPENEPLLEFPPEHWLAPPHIKGPLAKARWDEIDVARTYHMALNVQRHLTLFFIHWGSKFIEEWQYKLDDESRKLLLIRAFTSACQISDWDGYNWLDVNACNLPFHQQDEEIDEQYKARMKGDAPKDKLRRSVHLPSLNVVWTRSHAPKTQGSRGTMQPRSLFCFELNSATLYKRVGALPRIVGRCILETHIPKTYNEQERLPFDGSPSKPLNPFHASVMAMQAPHVVPLPEHYERLLPYLEGAPEWNSWMEKVTADRTLFFSVFTFKLMTEWEYWRRKKIWWYGNGVPKSFEVDSLNGPQEVPEEPGADWFTGNEIWAAVEELQHVVNAAGFSIQLTEWRKDELETFTDPTNNRSGTQTLAEAEVKNKIKPEQEKQRDESKAASQQVDPDFKAKGQRLNPTPYIVNPDIFQKMFESQEAGKLRMDQAVTELQEATKQQNATTEHINQPEQTVYA